MRIMRSVVLLLALALLALPGQASSIGHPANRPAPSIWRELSAPFLLWWRSAGRLPEPSPHFKSRGTMDPNGGSSEATAADPVPGDSRGTMDPNG